MTLSNPQKRQLKALAHAKKPVVIIGTRGLAASVLAEIELALDHHELIKVRINAADQSARQLMISQICQQLQAELVQRVGHVATLFRRNPDAPRINLRAN